MFEVIALLGFTVFLSLTGVMMPGPVFAATVAKGYKDGKAGIPIALGHGSIEFPVMVAVYYVASWLQDPKSLAIIGVIGGLLLILMGCQIIRFRKSEEEKYMPYPSFLVGVITTLSNPFFFLWWATVGFTLLMLAAVYGILVVILFGIVHWSCDLLWDTFVSFLVNKSRRLWTPRTKDVIFVLCGSILIGFGFYFIWTTIVGNGFFS
ncbi:MAG: LysE family transporter [Thermoplasmata archaeon]